MSQELEDILDEDVELSESQILKSKILELFRQAAFNVFLHGLKDPYIYNFADKDDPVVKELPEHIKYQLDMGFFIDTRTWRVFFDINSIPKHLKTEKEILEFSEGIFEHEFGHYIIYPRSKRIEAKQIAAISESFTRQDINQDAEIKKFYSYMMNNIFGDLIIEMFYANGFGRDEGVRERTIKRYQDIVTDVKNQQGVKKDSLWTCMIKAFEKLFNKDLGLDKVVKIKKNEEQTAYKIVQILGEDWRDPTKWLEKLREFTKATENILVESIPIQYITILIQCIGGDGSSDKISDKVDLPDLSSEITKTWGDLFNSPLGCGGGDVSSQIEGLKRLNPAKFAGAMSALKGEEPEDAIRYLYRARAEELLMKFRAEDKKGHQQTVYTRTHWQPHESITGKTGLRYRDSIMSHGRVIPYINTGKVKMRKLPGISPQTSIADHLIIIDSSGSMGFDPFNENPNRRGRFDKAILAGEGSTLEALDKGAKVAVINFAGEKDVKICDYTNNLDEIERTLMYRSKSGTMFPCNEIAKMMQKTKNRLYVTVLSDCDLYNEEEAIKEMMNCISEFDKFCVFQTKTGPLTVFAQTLKDAGANVFPLQRIEDLFGIVVGETIKEYNPEYDVVEWD